MVRLLLHGPINAIKDEKQKRALVAHHPSEINEKVAIYFKEFFFFFLEESNIIHLIDMKNC